MKIPQVSFALIPTAMLSTDYSSSFGKAHTPIYLTFYIIYLHIDALSHAFAYGGLQCLSESRGGSHETKSIFEICVLRYYTVGMRILNFNIRYA